MTRTFIRGVSWPIVVAGLAAPFAVHCGGSLPGGGGGLPGIPGVGGGSCPDMANVEAIEKFDFAKEFKLKAEVGGKIKAAAAAAADTKAVADKIEADLKVACATLAKDLSVAGDFADAQSACKAAAKGLGDLKAKMGANAKISLSIDEPHCGVDINAYADCAGHCDASVSGGKAEVKCEPGKLQGQCSAKCSGECELSASAQCTGECHGTCDADIKGTCGGKCTGKCDGKVMDAKANGVCDGTCEGKCDANISGECKGKCGGSCKISGSAECKGTCSGSCTAEMQAPKCTGSVEPPKMSAECKAKCDAHAQAKVECTPPRVSLKVTGSADAKAEAQFRTVIAKDYPAVLAVSLGVGKGALQVAGNLKAVVDGAQAGIQTAGDPMVVAKLSACVAAPFKGAVDAAASVQANVNVSVNVQASATASGKAG